MEIICTRSHFEMFFISLEHDIRHKVTNDQKNKKCHVGNERTQMRSQGIRKAWVGGRRKRYRLDDGMAGVLTCPDAAPAAGP